MAAVYASITLAQVQGNVQAQLVNLRKALETVNNTYLWLSAYSNADLVALGFTSADAAAVLSAMSDARALYLIWLTGQAPASYPQVGSPYVYSASQRIISGPAA